LDALQQTLFAIGASLYQRGANDSDDGNSDEHTTMQFDSTNVPPSLDDDDNFEDDATVTADYEAVD
jgi:molecular chaperone DnaK